MDIYEGEKYYTTKEQLRTTLNKYGVAIIPSVLNESECSNMLNGMWDYFEHISNNWVQPITRTNTNSWKEIFRLYPLHSMLIQYWNVGHAQVSWDVRQNPKIVDIFAHFWGCSNEELLVSFDGLSFNLPPEITKRGWNKDYTWFHTDQSYTRNNFECMQSWVTSLDVNPGDATLAFMEGSNNFHNMLATQFNISDKMDWYKLTKEMEKFYLYKGCMYKKIKCPKGSMVFWDSRTIHCGVEAMKERSEPNIRSIVYLCYTPRSQCNKKNLEKKVKAFNELRTTSHWPHKPKLFGKNPRTYGCELPVITNINAPILSELGLKLAGI